jgi:hypothetical protein
MVLCGGCDARTHGRHCDDDGEHNDEFRIIKMMAVTAIMMIMVMLARRVGG